MKINICPDCFICYEAVEKASCPECGYREPLKRCRDCGRFVSSERWVQMTPENIKTGKAPLCSPCHSNYDDPMCH